MAAGGVRRWPWFLLGMFTATLVGGLCLGSVAAVGVLSDRDIGVARNGVAVIGVEGTIVTGEAPSGLTRPANAYADEIVGFIREAAANPSARALVIRVESPGGGVVASDEIYQALREVDKPVVVSMGSVAASGGYYIACAADEILANANTLTGSIGVISMVPNVEGLLEKVGVKMYVLASGPHKEGGTFGPFTEAERAIWQSIIDETYGNFVQVVVDGRELPEDRVRQLADGRIYTGQQALDAGLVDRLGNLSDAIARAGELGGIVGEPRIIRYRSEPSILGGLGFRTSASPLVDGWQELLVQPLAVHYLYLRP